MANKEKKVALKDTSAHDKVSEFAPDHAERLLAYPGTKWAKLTAETAEGETLPPATNEERTAPASGKKTTSKAEGEK